MTREILFFENHFIDFYTSLDFKAQEKIEYVFKVVRTVEKVPVKFFKHIEGTDGLFEIRVKSRSNIYRIFCCFDQGKIVVLFNGFQKKSQRTPRTEIERALKLKKKYFSKPHSNENY